MGCVVGEGLGARLCDCGVEETRAKHDAAAIQADTPPPGCCRPRTLSSRTRGNERGSLPGALSRPLAFSCAVRVQCATHMSNMSSKLRYRFAKNYVCVSSVSVLYFPGLL